MDRYDPRWAEDRDRSMRFERAWGSRAGRKSDDPRECDGADAFTSQLDLPRGQERELAVDRERVYELSGRESRGLAAIGAFRVIDVDDLRTPDCEAQSRRPESDIQHLRESGLVETVPLGGCRREAVVLTKAGRDLLEVHRLERGREPRQEFYAGLRKPRELAHDSQVYRAYVRVETRLREDGGRVRRVVLDYELKREYQRFLHERNRGREDSDGRPDREAHENLCLGTGTGAAVLRRQRPLSRRAHRVPRTAMAGCATKTSRSSPATTAALTRRRRHAPDSPAIAAGSEAPAAEADAGDPSTRAWRSPCCDRLRRQ